MRYWRNFVTRQRAAWANSSRRRLARLMVRSFPLMSSCILVWICLNAVLPNLLALAMGRVIATLPAATRYGLSSPYGHLLDDAVIVFCALFLSVLLLGPIQGGLAANVKTRVTYHLQRRLMRAVCEPVGIEHLEDPAVLDKIALAQGSLMSYYPADAPMTLANIVGNRLQGVVSCALLAYYTWWIGLLAALLWLGARVPLRRVQNQSVRAYTGEAGIMRRANYFSALAIRPIAAKELRVFGLGDWVVEQFRAHFLNGMRVAWANNYRYFSMIPSIGALALVLYLGFAAYLAHAAYTASISVATTAVMLTLLSRAQIIGGITLLDVSLEWMLSAFPQLDLVEDELGSFRADAVGDLPVGDVPRQSIAFEHVSFRYPGATAPVFDEIDLSIQAGTSTAIVGVNGAGKTTLVKLLARLHEPSSGRITVDGLDLRSYDARAWQQNIAVVFQDFNQYPLSAWDNVQLGAYGFASDRKGAIEAAERAGAISVIEALPREWDTVLSRQYEGGVDLSGGEWQRVALARALFAASHGAKVLVLDEPTAWLDARGEAAFYERFLEITAGVTTIVISHRFSTVRLANQICVIDAGRVVERGSHDELIAANGIYASMFNMQAARFADDAEQEGR